MSNTLDSKDFGLKLYNRFPAKYREDDVGEKYALKRYLESLSDGGFSYVIDDINGILSLKDPDTVDAKLLPILFKHFGLEVFNGIPENYLRYLLPKLGEAWAKKGSLSVVEFITSSLSGVKVSPNVTYDSSGNPLVDLKLEMDYNIGNYFPDVEHFNRILANFLPFYCDLTLIYTYMFYELESLSGLEKDFMRLRDIKEESSAVKLLEVAQEQFKDLYNEERGLEEINEYVMNDLILKAIGETTKLVPADFIVSKCLTSAEESVGFQSTTLTGAITTALGVYVLGTTPIRKLGDDVVDYFTDHIEEFKDDPNTISEPVDSFINNGYNKLNSNFYLNGLYFWDKIITAEKTEIRY